MDRNLKLLYLVEMILDIPQRWSTIAFCHAGLSHTGQLWTNWSWHFSDIRTTCFKVYWKATISLVGNFCHQCSSISTAWILLGTNSYKKSIRKTSSANIIWWTSWNCLGGSNWALSALTWYIECCHLVKNKFHPTLDTARQNPKLAVL